MELETFEKIYFSVGFLPRGDHKNLAGPVNLDFRNLGRHVKISNRNMSRGVF